MSKRRIIFEVEQVRGSCPLYEVGSKIVIDTEPLETINVKESDDVCMRVVDNMSYRGAWTAGNDDIFRHIAGVNGECRLQCPNPGEPYTRCGTVVFRVRREKLGG